MALIFYPYPEDAQKGSLVERLEVLREAAERYKSIVLDQDMTGADVIKPMMPREQAVAYNWEEIACALREIREMPEADKMSKQNKAIMLEKLAEIYEILRAAKMPKLEAVRLALMSEVTQLKGSLGS